MTEFMYPTEVIQLPSQGKYYPEGHPLRENGGKLDVKYMTAKEEDILTSTNLIANGTVVDKLLDSLVIHKGVKHTDLTTGDANAVLLASRILAYGKDYPVVVNCTKCNKEIEHTVDLTKLEFPDKLEQSDSQGCISFETPTGLQVKIKPMTRGQEIKVEKDIKAIQDKLKKEYASEVTSRLKEIIVSINGNEKKSDLSTQIDNLIIKDTKFIREQIDKSNPSVDMTLEVTCDCGHTTKGDIPIGINFLWPED